MKNNNVEIDICIDGKPVKAFGLDGKTYVEAKNGLEYSIRIKNNNAFRVLVVSSVDGLDTMTGEPATKNGGGYIVNAYSSFQIKGYRHSLNDVGAFRFTQKPASYAAEKNASENAGIIGVAVFGEKINIPPWQITYGPNWINTISYSNLNNDLIVTSSSKADTYTLLANNNVGGNTITLDTSSLKRTDLDVAGTNWGSKIEDKVQDTEFIKASDTALAVFEIYYGFRQQLESLGIKFEVDSKISFPSAFPRDFARPPSGWQGNKS